MTTPKEFIVWGGSVAQEWMVLSVDRDSYATPVQFSVYPEVRRDAGDDRFLCAFLSPTQVDELIEELERIRERLREPDSVGERE